MIKYNDTPQRQFIMWMIYNNSFVYVNKECLQNDFLKVYTLLEAQYDASGAIDITLLTDKFRWLLDATGDEYFPRNYEPIVDAMEKENRKRKIWEKAQVLIGAVENLEHGVDCDDLIINHIDDTSKLMQNYKKINYVHSESVEQCQQKIDKNRNMVGELKGIKSGLVDLDTHIRGWQNGKLYVLGGLKKTGKSRFAISIVSHWLNFGANGIFFSMEMREDDIHTCVLANRLAINTAVIGTSKLTNEQYNLIDTESKRYKNQGLIINRTSSIRAMDVKNEILRQKSKGEVKFVVIDYLQRMVGDGATRAAQVEGIITKLADIARDENVIMLVLSQLSGSAEHKTDSPIYAFFKESQAITEACDCALVLFDEERGKEKSSDGFILKCMVLQRDGESDFVIPIFSELKYSRFTCVKEDF